MPSAGGETPGPRIWVDADACPGVVREILFRAAKRSSRPLILVANRLLAVPPSPWIRALQVEAGFDVADREIARRAAAGDLVVTADIPLAAAVIAKGAEVIDFRGERYGADNIAAALTLRNFMSELRDGGVQTGGPAAFAQADRQSFANALDRILLRWSRNRPEFG